MLKMNMHLTTSKAKQIFLTLSGLYICDCSAARVILDDENDEFYIFIHQTLLVLQQKSSLLFSHQLVSEDATLFQASKVWWS